MKRNSQQTLYRIVILAAVYAVLVFVMLKAESEHPESSIHSVYDVVWYTLTTLTTVGYGDMYPVSTLGRLIGMIFLLLSLGFLALLVGLSVSFLRNRLIPVWYLRSSKGRRTALFNTCNAKAEVLATALRAEADPYITVFAGTEGRS
ncbi:MAG: potassium channel family protein, partial [Erysipelotrichaceae bacterium]|nr:potassium channel family protein [Erysipelotrichaceae bacterium]